MINRLQAGPRMVCRRVSVGAMILFIVIVGAGLALIVYPCKAQHDGVTAIEKAGGHVIYDSSWKNFWLDAGFDSISLKRMVDYAGMDYFASVVEVDLIRVGSDPLMVHVGRFRKLKSLSLSRSSVSSAGLKHLEGLAHLKHLALDETRITDAGLAHLRGLTSLTELYVGRTEITDRGLDHLRALSNLDEL